MEKSEQRRQKAEGRRQEVRGTRGLRHGTWIGGGAYGFGLNAGLQT